MFLGATPLDEFVVVEYRLFTSHVLIIWITNKPCMVQCLVGRSYERIFAMSKWNSDADSGMILVHFLVGQL